MVHLLSKDASIMPRELRGDPDATLRRLRYGRSSRATRKPKYA